MTWTAMLSAWPHGDNFIKAAAAISGRLMPDLLRSDTPLNTRLAPPSQLQDISMFASHGTADRVTPISIGRENVVNFAGTASMRPDTRLEWHEYESDYHVISATCKGDVVAWLHK
eukprot:SAG31_NODE_15946_length_730_cov_1.068146_1_plen_114_part_10